jgi:hypothetical protein
MKTTSAGSPTGSTPGSSAPPQANDAELAAVAAEIRAQAPPPAAAAPAPGAAEREEALIDVTARMAEGDVALLAQLTEEDVAAIFELGFGVAADYRGPHWEMPAASPEAVRLAKFVKRSIDRHGWEWLAKWVPDVMAVLLLGYAISKRWQRDQELAAEANRKKTEQEEEQERVRRASASA